MVKITKQYLEGLVNKLPKRSCEYFDDLLQDINSAWSLHEGKGITAISPKADHEYQLAFLYDKIIFYKTNNIFFNQQYCNEDHCFLPLEEDEYKNIMVFHKLVKEKLSINKDNREIKKPRLVFNVRTGEITFNGKKCKPLAYKSNEHSLLLHLSQNLFQPVSADVLIKDFRDPKNRDKDNNIQRRVRDTIKAVRKRLGITKDNPVLTTNNNHYCLSCEVKFV